MRRRFTFDDGVLACGAPSREDSEDSEQKKKSLPPGGNFPDAATRVERVVLLGADAGTYASEAEVRVFSKSTDGVSERTFAVDVERAPTSERGERRSRSPARKPDVAVADDWSVRFFTVSDGNAERSSANPVGHAMGSTRRRGREARSRGEMRWRFLSSRCE